eukprot:maker-scaffold352_size199037-snap-gene-0.31 protein:Tk08711 transcript:maker-scaffold352_size199037-snap-gene-0.31-mRNA-1 annotation:"wash complex subunit fam21c-like"
MDPPVGWEALARIEAPDWSVLDDPRILAALERLGTNLENRAQRLWEKFEKLEDRVAQTDIKFDNITNQFLLLANTQFIENRVYDEDDPCVDDDFPAGQLRPHPAPSEQETRKANQDQLDLALKNGLDFLTQNLDRIKFGAMGSEELDGSDMAMLQKTRLEGRHPYHMRPLPPLIGSAAYLAGDLIGHKQDRKKPKDANPDERVKFSSDDASPGVLAQVVSQVPPKAPEPPKLSSQAGVADPKPAPSPSVLFDSDSGDDLFHMASEDLSSTPQEPKPEVSFADELAQKLGLSPASKATALIPSAPRLTQGSPPRPASKVSSTIFGDLDESDDSDGLFNESHKPKKSAEPKPVVGRENKKPAPKLFGETSNSNSSSDSDSIDQLFRSSSKGDQGSRSSEAAKASYASQGQQANQHATPPQSEISSHREDKLKSLFGDSEESEEEADFLFKPNKVGVGALAPPKRTTLFDSSSEENEDLFSPTKKVIDAQPNMENPSKMAVTTRKPIGGVAMLSPGVDILAALNKRNSAQREKGLHGTTIQVAGEKTDALHHAEGALNVVHDQREEQVMNMVKDTKIEEEANREIKTTLTASSGNATKDGQRSSETPDAKSEANIQSGAVNDVEEMRNEIMIKNNCEDISTPLDTETKQTKSARAPVSLPKDEVQSNSEDTITAGVDGNANGPEADRLSPQRNKNPLVGRGDDFVDGNVPSMGEKCLKSVIKKGHRMARKLETKPLDNDSSDDKTTSDAEEESSSSSDDTIPDIDSLETEKSASKTETPSFFSSDSAAFSNAQEEKSSEKNAPILGAIGRRIGNSPDVTKSLEPCDTSEEDIPVHSMADNSGNGSPGEAKRVASLSLNLKNPTLVSPSEAIKAVVMREEEPPRTSSPRASPKIIESLSRSTFRNSLEKALNKGPMSPKRPDSPKVELRPESPKVVLRPESPSSPEDGLAQEKRVSEPPSDSEVAFRGSLLVGANKVRPRGSVKRRPPTRKSRIVGHPLPINECEDTGQAPVLEEVLGEESEDQAQAKVANPDVERGSSPDDPTKKPPPMPEAVDKPNKHSIFESSSDEDDLFGKVSPQPLPRLKSDVASKLFDTSSDEDDDDDLFGSTKKI